MGKGNWIDEFKCDVIAQITVWTIKISSFRCQLPKCGEKECGPAANDRSPPRSTSGPF
jgi:hypothetical protein